MGDKCRLRPYNGQYIRPLHLNNFVVVASKLKEFDKARQIISDYKNEVRPELAENVFQFNQSVLLFYESRYSEALDALNAIDKYYDDGFKVNCRKLRLKIYYDMSNIHYITFEAEVETLKRFVKNNAKLDKVNKEALYNFFRFAFYLYRIKTRNSKRDIEKFVEKLKTEPLLRDRQWLLEKAATIKVPKYR